MYAMSGNRVRYQIDSDYDVELDVGDETVWLSEETLERMLEEIRKEKETK